MFRRGYISGKYTQNIHNLFTRSNPSEEEIAPEIVEKKASVKYLLKGISAFYPIFFMEDCKARIGDEQLTCKINNKQFEQKK
jgi:hypothetical protein